MEEITKNITDSQIARLRAIDSAPVDMLVAQMATPPQIHYTQSKQTWCVGILKGPVGSKEAGFLMRREYCTSVDNVWQWMSFDHFTQHNCYYLKEDRHLTDAVHWLLSDIPTSLRLFIFDTEEELMTWGFYIRKHGSEPDVPQSATPERKLTLGEL